MTRAFDPGRPVPAALLDELVDLASRAPSAGKAQGWHLVVLEGEQSPPIHVSSMIRER